MVRNSTERGARCQVRSGVERIRSFLAHQVMSRRQHNSTSIYKLRDIMPVIKGMTRFLFRSHPVLFFSLSCFNYASPRGLVGNLAHLLVRKS